MGKLIQLKLSDRKLKKYNKLVELLGLKGTFGEYQKAIEFGIDLTLSTIRQAEEVLPTLSEDKLAVFLSSIKRLRKERIKQDLIKKITKQT